MKNINAFLYNILENLNRADALPELNPKERGTYFSLKCPSCQQDSAFIYKQSNYIYCNRKNKCGYVQDIIEFIAERDSITNEEVIKRLAELTNTQLPELSTEEKEIFHAQKIKDSLLVDILSIAKSGLWTQPAKRIRDYLHERKYSDNDIIFIGFGFLPVVDELKSALLKKNHSPSLVDEILSSFRNTHPLLIPVHNAFGSLEGFVSRAINDEMSPKYLYPKGFERGAEFFNFCESKKEHYLIVVEGIIDAMLLTARGVKGAVACGGDSPTQNQINHALKYGKAENIILCLDNDEAGQKGTERAIELLKNKKVLIFVANTEPHKDPDEFLKFNSVEALQKRIFSAESWVKWQAKYILRKRELANDIGRENELEELLRLESSLKAEDIEKSQYILDAIEKELKFPRNLLESKLLSFHEKRSKERQAETYKKLLQDALKLSAQGRYEDLAGFLTDGIAKTKSLVLSNIVTAYSSEKALEDIQKRQEGLKTCYEDIDQFLSIPSGAITLIAGRPSHCKTTFLLNLMNNLVSNYPTKSFFFFSYEESKTALYVKIINIMSETVINETLKNKNTQQIEYYLKGGLKQQEKHYKSGLENPFYKIEQSVFLYDEYVNENRLWLIDNPLEVETLASTLESLTYKYDIGAVFIDYAQRIKYGGKYENERVKIARISEALRETATRLDIPLIVGCQLNRENAKAKPQLDNLKEAGNLEEDANLVLGLYNWKTAIDKEKADEENTKDGTNKKKLKNCKGTEISILDRNIDFEVHILKNRNGVINESALLSFDAPILKIKEK